MNNVKFPSFFHENTPLVLNPFFETVSPMSSSDIKVIAIGVDEVGRGSLIGPIYAAACWIHDQKGFEIIQNDINDSKKLTAQKRTELVPLIQKYAYVCVSEATQQEVDHLNPHYASLLAMEKAITHLQKKITDHFFQNSLNQENLALKILIDGLHVPKNINSIIDQNIFDHLSHECLTKGDEKSYSIACASIVAKVQRDLLMDQYHQDYPQYAWDKNRGYGSQQHLKAIKQHGPSPYHRLTFNPVKSMLKDMSYMDILS